MVPGKTNKAIRISYLPTLGFSSIKIVLQLLRHVRTGSQTVREAAPPPVVFIRAIIPRPIDRQKKNHRPSLHSDC